MTTPENPEPPKRSPEKKTNPAVRVRVLKSGLHIAGGVAAKGAILSVPASDAEFREKRGEITIL